jgi:hypothetical protein
MASCAQNGKKKGRGKANAPAANNGTPSKKVAQSVGGAQAKRAATTAQVRTFTQQSLFLEPAPPDEITCWGKL